MLRQRAGLAAHAHGRAWGSALRQCPRAHHPPPRRTAARAPEKQSGMEMMNQSAMSEKNAVSGMAPLEPVRASRMLSALSAASVMPGK